MNIEPKSKINQLLLSATPKGLLFSEWLKRNGYSDQLIKRYRESGWLEMLSKGVMYRTGDSLSAYAALSCYNRQLGKKIRVAAHSALELFGFNHYVPMGKPLLMVAHSKQRVPEWMRKDVFDRVIKPFSTESHNGRERRSGFTGFHSGTGILGVFAACAATILLYGFILYDGTTDNAAPRNTTTTA